MSAHRRSPTSHPLHLAASKGWMGEVALALNQGIPIDALDNEGCTALWRAVQHNQGGVARLLRGLNADPNVPCTNGRTVLHLAIALADQHHLDLLLGDTVHPRIDANATDQEGHTPLHEVGQALRNRVYPESYRMQRRETWWDELAQRLLDLGADPLRANRNGGLPLNGSTSEQRALVPGWVQATVAAEQRVLRTIAHNASAEAMVRTPRFRL